MPTNDNNAMRKSAFYAKPEFWVVIIAIAAAINSQLPAFVDPYVINGDIIESIYWMRQFNDSELFTNDLLTDYSKHYHSPWGYYVIYRTLSFFVDPVMISKILPIPLFAISSLYLFKLVRQFTDNYTGFLAALTFMIMPIFLGSMIGGHPRSFAYLLLIAFLYYLIRQHYGKASLLLIIQSLVYPMMFFLSVFTYAFSSIVIRPYQVSLSIPRQKLVYGILGVGLSMAVLSAKYIFIPTPHLGKVVTRSEMVNRPEFSDKGRADVLSVAPFSTAVMGLSRDTLLAVIAKYPVSIRRINKAILNEQSATVILVVLLLVAVSTVGVGVVRGKIFVPQEILYLFVASALMYTLADFLLLRLYQPSRYILYVVPLINVILVSLGLAYLTTQLSKWKVTSPLKAVVVVVMLLHVTLNRGVGLKDYGNYYYDQSGNSYRRLEINKNIYTYLNGLPKDTVIAAPPYLADNIPVFAQRKVLINSELSIPFHDKYWEEIQKRTIDFFSAYYARDCSAVRKFSAAYNIGYFVVDKRHFTNSYLSEDRMYFEPFNSYVKNLTQANGSFTLMNINEQDQLYKAGDVFVFDVKILANKCQ